MSDPMKDVEAAAAGEPPPDVLFWQKEIDLAKKREKLYRKHAAEVIKIYEAEKKDANSFNILYANTETLLPAVYNQLPRAIAERRYADADPLAKCAADVVERSLTYLLNSPDAAYEQYGDLFQAAALGALVPGRGVTWWRYDAEFRDKPPPEPAADVADGAKAVADQEEHTGEIFPDPGKKVVWETICGEDINYDHFLHGYARRWVNVPWVSREHGMTREDAEENFGKEVADLMTFSKPKKEDKFAEEDEDENNHGSVETATVYEIWWKQKKKVVFYHPELKDRLCLEIDDPYKLSGFFPCPEPLRFLLKRSKLTPTPPYKIYETQAKELNNITRRISRVLNAIKVRGFYDHTLQGIGELLKKDDNELIAVKNVASLQQGQNLANSITLMPLDELIKVLNQLYEAQANCKATIYEITGIADIMRGDTQASETATAQNIKNKWGTLRLQKMQGATQDYIRDCLRIVAELVAEHFGVDTLAAMTNLDYALPQDVAQAQKMQQAVQAALQQWQSTQAQAMPPPPGAPAAGPPPAPQQPPPQIQQEMQQVQTVLSKPQWSQVVQLLQNDLLRGYRVDIETNSTLANTSSEDQDNVNKAMTAISNMYKSFLPAVQAGAMTMQALKEMLLSVCRRFEFGRQVEQAIASMPDQLPPPPPDPKIDADLQKQKMDFAAEKAEQAQDMAAAQQELAGREAKLAQDGQSITMQVEAAKADLARTAKETLAQQKIQDSEQQLALETRLNKHEQNMQKALMKMQALGQKQKADRDQAAADKTAETDGAAEKLGASHQELMTELQDLRKSRDAPIEIIRGEDGKPSHVKQGDKTRAVKRDAKTGKATGLH